MAAGKTAVVNAAAGLITKSRRSALKSSREGTDASFIILLATYRIGASRPSEAGLENLGNQLVQVVGLDAQLAQRLPISCRVGRACVAAHGERRQGALSSDGRPRFEKHSESAGPWRLQTERTAMRDLNNLL